MGKTIDSIKIEKHYMTAIKDHVAVRVDMRITAIEPLIIPINIALMLKDIDEEYIEIKNGSNIIKIITENQRYTISRNVPIPNNEEQALISHNFKELTTLHFPDFQGIISQLLPISRFSYTKNIGGIMLDADGKRLTITGTDGICLTQRTMLCEDTFRLCFNERIKKLTKIKYNGEVKIFADNLTTAFKLGDCTIYMTSQNARFFNISDMYIDRNIISLDRKSALNIVSRLAQIPKQPMTVNVSDGMIVFSIKKSDRTFFEKLTVDNKDMNFNLKIDPKYAKIILKSMHDDKIDMRFSEDKNFINFSDSNSVWVLSIIQQRRNDNV